MRKRPFWEDEIDRIFLKDDFAEKARTLAPFLQEIETPPEDWRLFFETRFKQDLYTTSMVKACANAFLFGQAWQKYIERQ